MPKRTFYATRDMKHPQYRTRRLQAGDEVEVDLKLGRVFERMGMLTTDAPARSTRAKQAQPAVVEADETETVETKPTRRRAAARKKK